MNIKKITTLGIILLIPYWISAQDTLQKDSIKINLEKAIEIALNESPSMRIADRTIQTKKYYKSEQIAALFPDVSMSAGYNRTIKKQVMSMNFGGQATEIEVGSANSYSAGLSLYLPIIVPALWNNVKLSQLDVNLALESARSSKIALIKQVKQAYYTYLLAQESYQVLNQNYENVKLNNKIVTDKYLQGLASEFEKLRSDVQLKNQRPNVTSAEKAVKLSLMMLKIVLGVDINEPLIFEGAFADYEHSITETTIPNLTDLTLSGNSDLKQMDLSLQQLEVSRKLIVSSSCPSLVLSGNYQYMSLNDDFKFKNYNWFPYSVIGLSLSIPIVSWAGTSYKMKQSKLSIENLKDQKLNVERNLWLSVQSNLNDINQAIEDLASNKESMLQAEKAYKIAQKQYEVGMATWLDLNSAELSMVSSQLSYNQSIYNYMTAQAELEAVLGQNN